MKSSSLTEGAPIVGVELRHLDLHADPRGSFTEVFKKGWNSVVDPVQFSIVASEAGVMRGCHFHLNHDEYFCLLKGEASVGLRDERPESPTRGVWSLYTLHEEDMAALIFPRGLVHGWYFSAPSLHLQAVSESYDDYADTDNHRVHWRDPDLEIPWPANEATVTDLAETAPGLAELRRRLFSGR